MKRIKIRDEAVAVGVAVAAFAASAEHIIHVVTTTGGSTYTAWTYPLGVDGLVYVGIASAQRGRRKAGLLAIAIGALYSLAFNGHALGAFEMPRLLIAASMPICMLAAFVIVHTGKRDEDETTEPVPPTKDEDVYAEDADVVKAAEQILADADAVAPVASKPSRPSGTGRGRGPSWDVADAVKRMDAGESNEDIADVYGISYKPVQRTRRALELVRTTEQADAEIGKTCGLSAAHVALVRSAA